MPGDAIVPFKSVQNQQNENGNIGLALRLENQKQH